MQIFKDLCQNISAKYMSTKPQKKISQTILIANEKNTTSKMFEFPYPNWQTRSIHHSPNSTLIATPIVVEGLVQQRPQSL